MVPSSVKAAFELEDHDEVYCCHCMLEGVYKLYRKGEAYLCDASHSPYNGNANYICKKHLDSDAEICG